MRGRRKIYPSLNSIWDTGSVTVGGVTYKNLASYALRNCHLFDGTLTYTDLEGETQYYPNLGFDKDKLGDYMLLWYGERKAGFPMQFISPFSPLNEVNNARNKVNLKLEHMTDLFIERVKYKYLTLVKSMDNNYDMLDNVHIVETETTDEGTKTLTHTPVERSGKTYTIQSDTVTLGEPEGGEGGPAVGVSVWDTAAKNSTHTSTTGPNATTDHLTTSFDNSATPRLESRDVVTNNSATGEQRNNPSALSSSFNGEQYTDLTTMSPTTRVKKRIGNEGDVQTLIEKERSIAAIDVVKMFFDELSSEICLSTWNDYPDPWNNGEYYDGEGDLP